MKKYVSLFLFLFLITNTVIAQVNSVMTNMYGDFELVIDLNDQEYVVVDAYGEVLEIKVMGRVEYHSDFNDYEAGKIRRIGNIVFSYYSGFNDYEAGKIKKIDNINFTYYSTFNDYEAGKVKRVGNIAFDYYSAFNDYEEGKIKRIGTTGFQYYSDFNDYEAGKIKQIGTNRYIYYSPHESSRFPGGLKSGERSFESGGIYFRFRR